MTADETNERRLTRLADHDDIRQVIYRYCRGIDRRQFDLVRDCYHEDGTDDHGNYRGGIDGFIEYVTKELAVWELTTHFIGNLLIECDGDGDSARAESYAVATHRLAARVDRPAKDFVAGVRYVDDFERRAGQWKIATRVCLVDWTRTDPVEAHGWTRPDTYAKPRHDRDDPVFAKSLRDL